MQPLIAPGLEALRSCVGLLKRFSGRYICGQRSGDLMEEFCRRTFNVFRCLESVNPLLCQSLRYPLMQRATKHLELTIGQHGCGPLGRKHLRLLGPPGTPQTRLHITAVPRLSPPTPSWIFVQRVRSGTHLRRQIRRAQVSATASHRTGSAASLPSWTRRAVWICCLATARCPCRKTTYLPFSVTALST